MKPALPTRVQGGIYRSVASSLGWDGRRDKMAAAALRQRIISFSQPRRIESELHGRPCIVLGAGPSVRRDVDKINALKLHLKCGLIAADGATCALLEVGLAPTVVVTDLDGHEYCLIRAASLGSLIVVHAHGDNRESVSRLVPQLRPVLGTCQAGAREPVKNLGGIMDGDRSVCLAVSACANPIVLAGMDLEGPVGDYSSMGRRSPDEAYFRLSVSKTVLSELCNHTKKTLLNATSGGGLIPGLPTIPWERLSEKLLVKRPRTG